MSKEGKFLIYCIEIYKNAKKLNGKEVTELFEKYDVFNYITTFFEALHTTGDQYIIEDIDGYIEDKITKNVIS